jgi:Xaa-Pro dipeptidase
MLLNCSRAVNWMEQCGLDALVATHWVNVLYLSDFHVWIQPLFKKFMLSPGESDAHLPLFALLPRHGEAAIVVDHSCELNAADIWVRDRYVYGRACDESTQTGPPDTTSNSAHFLRSRKRYQSSLDALAAALHERGLRDARIGIDLRHLPLEEHLMIRSALPKAQLHEATDLFRLVRMVKSEEELHRLRKAASIGEYAAVSSLQSATPGCDVQDIVQLFRFAVASHGADFDHFAYSRNGIGMATELSAKLDRPETLFVDFGCTYRHYYSDAGLTLNIGQPSSRVSNICHQLANCLEEARLAMKPGVRASTVQQAMACIFSSYKLDGYFPHGHSLGIEIREYPVLAPDSGRMIRDECVSMSADLALEEGMVINLEAPVFDLADAAFQLEQTYVISADGSEPLTNRVLSDPFVIH